MAERISEKGIGRFAEGTLTFPQIRRVLDEAQKIGSVKWIYFEGGEPFHVSKTAFEETVKNARDAGLRDVEGPNVLLSKTAILEIP